MAANNLFEFLFYEAAVRFSEIGKSEMALKVLKAGPGNFTFILYRPSVLTRYFQDWESTNGLTVGMMNVVISDENPKVFEVKNSAAEKGFGPAMYDIVMSYISPKFLMADRKDVSGAAQKVWKFMFDHRLAEYDTLLLPTAWDGTRLKTDVEDFEFLNLAYRLKKKLSIHTTLLMRDRQFFGNQMDKNRREEMLTILEEDAWSFFRDRMNVVE